ncbi:MAG: hypothetical protein D4R68_07720, partial [Ignavibacteriales bacterium]
LRAMTKKLIPSKIIHIKRKKMMENIIIGGRKLLNEENYLKIEKTIKEFGNLKGVLDIRV